MVKGKTDKEALEDVAHIKREDEANIGITPKELRKSKGEEANKNEAKAFKNFWAYKEVKDQTG